MRSYPKKTVVVPDDVWDEFGKEVGVRSRSPTVRRWIRQFLRYGEVPLNSSSNDRNDDTAGAEKQTEKSTSASPARPIRTGKQARRDRGPTVAPPLRSDRDDPRAETETDEQVSPEADEADAHPSGDEGEQAPSYFFRHIRRR